MKKTKLEQDIYRIIINWNPRREPDGDWLTNITGEEIRNELREEQRLRKIQR